MILKALAAFALIVLKAQGRTTTPQTGDPNFDVFMFAQRNPTAICEASEPGACEIPPGAKPWVIYGLWPHCYKGPHPIDCAHDQFNISEFSVLQSHLEVTWPNLIPGETNAGLWEHQWVKHGSCAKPVRRTRNQLLYFDSALYLYLKFNVSRVLDESGIKPSKTQQYNASEIHRALSLSFGSVVKMHCVEDVKTGKHLFADVRVCVTKDFRPADCSYDPDPLARELDSKAGKIPAPKQIRKKPVQHRPFANFVYCPESIFYVLQTE